MYERLKPFLDWNYTLEQLQQMYGRKEDAVSYTARTKRLKVRYEWQEKSIEFINRAYSEIGPVTIRQVHYHLVGLGVSDYENDMKHYNKLITWILRARLAGAIGWHMITETETLTYTPVISGVADVDEAVKRALETIPPMGRNPWDAVKKHVYVFTEKRELYHQIVPVAYKWFVPLVCFKGYGAVWTRIYGISDEIKRQVENDDEVYVLVISDHDPSGLDINRFYMAMLKHYYNFPVTDVRVALTARQIVDYKLPPNPAKAKDPRFKWYSKLFGSDSWEVDALVTKDIKELQKLLDSKIVEVLGSDLGEWNRVVEENQKMMEEVKERLSKMGGGE